MLERVRFQPTKERRDPNNSPALAAEILRFQLIQNGTQQNIINPPTTGGAGLEIIRFSTAQTPIQLFDLSTKPNDLHHKGGGFGVQKLFELG